MSRVVQKQLYIKAPSLDSEGSKFWAQTKVKVQGHCFEKGLGQVGYLILHTLLLIFDNNAMQTINGFVESAQKVAPCSQTMISFQATQTLRFGALIIINR